MHKSQLIVSKQFSYSSQIVNRYAPGGRILQLRIYNGKDTDSCSDPSQVFSGNDNSDNSPNAVMAHSTYNGFARFVEKRTLISRLYVSLSTFRLTLPFDDELR